jgi:hypothetical protein
MRFGRFMKASFSRRSGNFVPRFPSVHVDKHWELQSVANSSSLIYNVLSRRRELEKLQPEERLGYGLNDRGIVV